jgi:hypothetical protein
MTMLLNTSKRSVALALVILTAALWGPFSARVSAQGLPACPALLDAIIGPIDPTECASSEGTAVQLDGSDSSVGADISYLWTAPGVVFVEGTETSLAPLGIFPLGITPVMLTVTCDDGINPPTIAEAVMNVEIVDTTLPTISALADKTCLWPPNHKYHQITMAVDAQDTCDPAPVVVLGSVVSNEPDNDIGDGNTINDVMLGEDDLAFSLRSERQGPGSGRVYTATYTATDASDNFTDAFVLVTVPHDMGQGKGTCDLKNRAAKDALKAAKKGNKGGKTDKAARKAAKEAEKAARKAARDAAKAAKKSN